MKNDKIIIYDDSCPMCAAYTKGFVFAGMIKNENRKNFSTIEPSLLSLIDTNRCKNEIPVVDEETKEVWYGIDAMLEILKAKIPLVKKLADFKIIRYFLIRTYKLISYNRRVIVASQNRPGNFDCAPDFNFKYRLVFMIFFLAANTAMLFPISSIVLTNSFAKISANELQYAHFTLVALNVIIALRLQTKTAFEYLGQVNMLAISTLLLTIPLLLLNKFQLITNPVINNIYLLLLLLVVLIEYRRRMNFAGILQNHHFIVLINIMAIAGFMFYLAC